MLEYLNQFYPYHHFLISMALGLLVGLQREWAESPLAGIRSFTLISLLGTLCAYLSESHGHWLIGVGFICTLGVILVGRLVLNKQPLPEQHRGLVTEISSLLTYGVGALVLKEPLLASSLACLMAGLLHIKLELHTMVARFDKNEIRSIMQFLIITLVILPVVPNQSFGPNGALNLHNIWFMVILIVGISLVGYIIYKFRGERTGIIWGGILGGIISSTATTLSYSRDARNTEHPLAYSSLIILIAWSTLYIRVFVELMAVAPNFKVMMPLLIMLLVSSVTIFWSWRKSHKYLTGVKLNYNPTGIKTALTFALSYSFIIYTFTFLRDYVGEGWLATLAFLSGIMDVDAITLSTGRLVHKGVITHTEGFRHLFLALLANISFKGILSFVVGGKELFKLIFLPWIISLLAAVTILISSFFY